jgi:hypothetical protein
MLLGATAESQAAFGGSKVDCQFALDDRSYNGIN